MPKFITLRKREGVVLYKPMSMKKKLSTALLSGAMMAMACFPAFAEGTTNIVTADDWKPVLDAVSAQFSVATIVQVLASCITLVIGIVFMWWGVRKGFRMLMGAVRGNRPNV